MLLIFVIGVSLKIPKTVGTRLLAKVSFPMTKVPRRPSKGIRNAINWIFMSDSVTIFADRGKSRLSCCHRSVDR